MLCPGPRAQNSDRPRASFCSELATVFHLGGGVPVPAPVVVKKAAVAVIDPSRALPPPPSSRTDGCLHTLACSPQNADLNQLKQLEADEALARSFAQAEATTAIAGMKLDPASQAVRPAPNRPSSRF